MPVFSKNNFCNSLQIAEKTPIIIADMLRQQKDSIALFFYATDIIFIACVIFALNICGNGLELLIDISVAALVWICICAALRNASPFKHVPFIVEAGKTVISSAAVVVVMKYFMENGTSVITMFATLFFPIYMYRRIARIVFGMLRKRGYKKTSAIVIGWSDKTETFLTSIRKSHLWNIDVCGVFCGDAQKGQLPGAFKWLGNESEVQKFLNAARQVDMAVSCGRGGIEDAKTIEALKKCADTGHEIIYFSPEPSGCGICECRYTLYGNSVYMANVPACTTSVLKLIMDFLSSAILLVLTSPIIVIISAIIKIMEPGAPVFFTQSRMGQHGRLFNIYKFRTMYKNAEEMKAKLIEKSIAEAPLFKLPDDPRITPFGRTLRRFGLDELPQLFNVIRGDMAMVGPRPHDAAEARNYEITHRIRLIAKPGITGLGQVSGGSILPFKQQVDLDIKYFKEWQPFLDVHIMLKTFPFIIKQGTVK